VRAVFRGDFWTAATLWGTAWALILAIAGLWVGTRTFRRENA
jgi:ABC-2 type transport system permease protein